MTPEQAADDLTERVMRKVGATNRNEVQCPREQSFMTPCIARDKSTALADDKRCVGCNADPFDLLADLISRQLMKEKEKE